MKTAMNIPEPTDPPGDAPEPCDSHALPTPPNTATNNVNLRAGGRRVRRGGSSGFGTRFGSLIDGFRSLPVEVI